MDWQDALKRMAVTLAAVVFYKVSVYAGADSSEALIIVLMSFLWRE